MAAAAMATVAIGHPMPGRHTGSATAPTTPATSSGSGPRATAFTRHLRYYVRRYMPGDGSTGRSLGASLPLYNGGRIIDR
jgi:hypothetical protein